MFPQYCMVQIFNRTLACYPLRNGGIQLTNALMVITNILEIFLYDFLDIWIRLLQIFLSKMFSQYDTHDVYSRLKSSTTYRFVTRGVESI